MYTFQLLNIITITITKPIYQENGFFHQLHSSSQTLESHFVGQKTYPDAVHQLAFKQKSHIWKLREIIVAFVYTVGDSHEENIRFDGIKNKF